MIIWFSLRTWVAYIRLLFLLINSSCFLLHLSTRGCFYIHGMMGWAKGEAKVVEWVLFEWILITSIYTKRYRNRVNSLWDIIEEINQSVRKSFDEQQRALGKSQVLYKIIYEILNHPPYILGLVPSSYYLLPKIKNGHVFFLPRTKKWSVGIPCILKTIKIYFFEGIHKVIRRSDNSVEVIQYFIRPLHSVIK